MDIIGIDKSNFKAVKGFFPADTEENLNIPEFIIYAAVDDREAVLSEVYGVLSFFVEKPEEEHEIRIDWLYVAPEKRGMGVGTLLTGELILSAKKAGVSLVFAELPSEDDTLDGFFIKRGFELEEQYHPFFEGTVGELASRFKRKKNMKKNMESMKELESDDREELINLYGVVSGDMNQDDELHIDLSDENKAAVFDELFEDCAMSYVRCAVLPLREDIREDSISIDEALMLLREDAAFLMPRFNALADRISEVRDGYSRGADSQDGPYISFTEDEGAFDVKLFIALSPDDSESFMVTAVSEFDIDIADIDDIEKKIELWEDEALYATAGLDRTYGKLIFEAGIPCRESVPGEEDLKAFTDSFMQEVRNFWI